MVRENFFEEVVQKLRKSAGEQDRGRGKILDRRSGVLKGELERWSAAMAQVHIYDQIVSYHVMTILWVMFLEVSLEINVKIFMDKIM